ncbi:D-aminopeptidase [Roseomonas sp. BN140053]|uniref:D-aminopeptidase n=1 Tax=Roseomonas sp. BN140053 TaxID=3391898 RepID=UPI0039EC3836
MGVSERLDRAVAALPGRYPGPGGALAVLREGEVLAQHCWGWADAQAQRPFTPDTMFLVCSITKQFTCSLLLDQFPDPGVLDADLRRLLPELEGEAPRTLDLCHNQSGLRDYWALAMLCGSAPEGEFGPDDARRLIGRTRSLHFAPGTRYSYSNGNFRLLSDLIEARTGRDFGTLLRERVLDRAAMPRAAVSPDTARVPGGTVGYEGSVEAGFQPAVNRIHWTGDAGLAASLDDLVAWERFIDATRDDADGLYRRLCAPVAFRDGTPAGYGFGLGRPTLLGRPITAHGGGLRGWRSFRCYAPAERVSVVVLFNHMADPRAAARDLFAAALGLPVAPPAPAVAATGWDGCFEEPETGLAARLDAQPDGRLRLRFAPGPEFLTPAGEDAASPEIRLHRGPEGIRMRRLLDHLDTTLRPCAAAAPEPFEGRFHCAELDADLTCVLAGGVPYAAFSGDLGQGAMQPLLPLAADTWLLPCPRALDFAAPGDWTVRLRRDGAGRVAGLQLGSWLARGLDYLPA